MASLIQKFLRLWDWRLFLLVTTHRLEPLHVPAKLRRHGRVLILALVQLLHLFGLPVPPQHANLRLLLV